MNEWTPIGAGPVTREQIAPRAAYIRKLGRGHRDRLVFTVGGGNTYTGRVQALETRGVRVCGVVVPYEQIVKVGRADG